MTNTSMISPAIVIWKNEAFISEINILRGQKGNVAQKIAEIIDDWVWEVQNQDVGATHEELDAVKNGILDCFRKGGCFLSINAENHSSAEIVEDDLDTESALFNKDLEAYYASIANQPRIDLPDVFDQSIFPLEEVAIRNLKWLTDVTNLSNFSNRSFSRSRIKCFIVENCALKTVTEQIFTENLKYLCVSGNYLKSIPHQIVQANHLKEVDFSQNEIDDNGLTDSMLTLANTTFLSYGNKLSKSWADKWVAHNLKVKAGKDKGEEKNEDNDYPTAQQMTMMG